MILTQRYEAAHDHDMARLGPGKFETSGAIGALFSAIAGEGFADEEAGDVSELGRWYARFDGPFNLAALKKDFAEEWTRIDADDVRTLMQAKGVIISEDTQGFIDVETYTSRKKLDKVWSGIEDDVADFIKAE